MIYLPLFSRNIKWETDSKLQFLIKHLNTTNLLIPCRGGWEGWWWIPDVLFYHWLTNDLLQKAHLTGCKSFTRPHHSKICMRGPKRLGNHFRKQVSPVKTRISLQQGSLGGLSSTCQPTLPNWPIRLWNIRSHWHWYPSPNSCTVTRLRSVLPRHLSLRSLDK